MAMPTVATVNTIARAFTSSDIVDAVENYRYMKLCDQPQKMDREYTLSQCGMASGLVLWLPLDDHLLLLEETSPKCTSSAPDALKFDKVLTGGTREAPDGLASIFQA